MSATTLALSVALPVTVTVSDRDAVLVEAGTRCIAMSPYSERAGRLAPTFGRGVTVLRTVEDVEALAAATASDLADALAY